MENVNDYDQIELSIIGRGGVVEARTYNKSNINYFRRYVERDGDTGQPRLKTAIYFKDNPKAVVVDCGYDTLKDVLDRSNKIKKLLSGLNMEQFKEVVLLAQKLKGEVIPA
jgi:hypothetical protein